MSGMLEDKENDERILIYGNRVVLGEDPTPRKGWLVIKDDKIEKIGEGDFIEDKEYPEDEINSNGINIYINCKENLVLPGAIDTHVHFREPGFSHKANWLTESRAAASGGVTSVVDMPNTIPVATTIELIEEKERIAAEQSLVNYAFWIGATSDNLEELKKADYTSIAGVKVFLGASTGKQAPLSAETLKNILSEVNVIVGVHAEDEALIRQKRDQIVEQYGGQPENVPLKEHSNIRSAEGCLKASKDVEEAQKASGGRCHIMHISTADELQQINFTDNLTCEACVGYLWFTSDDMDRLGAKIKVNPAIKTKKDQEALIKAIAEGKINYVSTDHAPHQINEKEGGALKAASGMPSIQFSLPIMLELADQGHFPISRVVECMCFNPARLLNIDRRGFIKEGYYADITVVKPNTPYQIDKEMIESLCRWSALEGQTLHNKVMFTFVNGEQAYPFTDEPSSAMPLRFNR